MKGGREWSVARGLKWATAFSTIAIIKAPGRNRISLAVVVMTVAAGKFMDAQMHARTPIMLPPSALRIRKLRRTARASERSHTTAASTEVVLCQAPHTHTVKRLQMARHYYYYKGG